MLVGFFWFFLVACICSKSLLKRKNVPVFNEFGQCWECWHFLSVLVHVLAAPFQVQLTVDGLGKQQKWASCLGCCTQVGRLIKHLFLGSSLAYPWPFGKWTSGWRISLLSVHLSKKNFFFFLFSNEIKKQYCKATFCGWWIWRQMKRVISRGQCHGLVGPVP